MHKSIGIEQSIEFINVTPLNPLISKCQIKVCYVSDEPNRNRGIITKEVARKLANSLPGSPIVGYYNEGNGDFEEHNTIIEISNGQLNFKENTRPYGFVDLNAKVWFQIFLDDDAIEREYLVTEGYLWTGQYPECQRIIDQGNNQSMKLDDNYLDAYWTKDDKGKPQFFIINEAIIQNLCILGEDVEPCFEGASITAPIQFSFEDGFKEQLFSMMNELKNILNEGGAKVLNTYAVDIGDSLWSAVWDYVHKTYKDPADEWAALYTIDSICEENGQKFAVLRSADAKYYRLNFSLSETEGFQASGTLIEVTKTYTPINQFAEADVAAYMEEYKKKNTKEPSEDEEKPTEDEKKSEEEKDNSDNESQSDDEEDKKKKKTSYSIEEYNTVVEQLNTLQAQYNALQETNNELTAQVESLTQFKVAAERKDKQAMINSFYMLSDDDKKDVVDHIDSYSLDDIEAKLSIICFRNKVSFDLDEEKKTDENGPITYNLDHDEVDNTPAWLKAAFAVAKSREE